MREAVRPTYRQACFAAQRLLRRGVRLCAVALALLLAIGLLGPDARAQAPDDAAPPFAVDAVSVRAGADDPASTRLDVYVRVPHARLQFLRAEDGFAARYELTLSAYRVDEDGDRAALAAQRTWEEAARAEAYAATRSEEHFSRSAQSFELRPGAYELTLRLRDPAAEGVLERTLSVEVRDLSGPVAISSLLVLDGFDAQKSTITPLISHRLSTDAGALDLFYELYADAPRRVRIEREVVRTRRSGSGVLSAILSLGRSSSEGERRGEVTYTQTETTPLEAGRTQRVVTIPLSDGRAGEYLVRVRVKSEGGQLLSEAETRVRLEWDGLDLHLRRVGDAIAQLSYIAKDRDLDYIRAGSTPEERLARLKAFWKKRDPTPGTERNERMEEYYYRVARANRSYSQEARDLTAGWKTDRGHVLVLFGEPDAIEEHNAQAQPYEVWRYERIGRQFVFVDEDGRGTYKLLEPIWNERTRIR